MDRCLLDILPVEIFDIIFEYFWAHEILASFHNVSPYLDAVLYSYSSYQVNFASILKPHFDHVCHTLRPNQIISLILSDDADTPRQSQIFLSHFQIKSFTRIRSLTLDRVERKSLLIILSHINKMNRQFRLFLHNCDIVPLSSMEIPFQLRGLRIGESNLLNPRYSTFVVNANTSVLYTDTFRHICANASGLKSLNIRCEDINIIMNLFSRLPQLTSLALKITRYLVSMNHIENVMLNLLRLKHLQLQLINSDINLADGQRWESVTSSLITFNFNFYIRLNEIERTLDTFRSLFWLQKRWFVAYEYWRLFSVPYFTNVHYQNSFQRFMHSTVIDDKTFLDNITTLELSRPLVDSEHYFPHVRTLIIINDIRLETLSSIIDINRVEHLILYFPITQALPNICHLLSTDCLQKLSIMSNPFRLLKQFRGMKFENIRTLEVKYDFEFGENYPIEELCSIFPRVERLHIRSINQATMIPMIDGFTHLSSASFYFDSLSNTNKEHWQVKPEWALYGARRLTNSSYICEYQDSTLHAWISEQVSQF
ncbi:unnamed protein product [Rotaria socialis]|uniref:F-box domain-containing protein n=1 Tax=Rotaria socialis TaxID=392032 RepID=A0A821DBX0_9BILA|nr:unnamed protein product [Rotaria socialis]